MSNFVSFLKWVAILAIVGLVIYFIVKLKQAAGSFSAAWDATKKEVVAVKSQLTPGWSSIVPLPGDMQPEAAAEYATIKAGEPNLNTPNPNLPWYEKPISSWWDSITGKGKPAGTPVTPQTVGTSASQNNIAPLDISQLTPINQPGATPIGPTLTTGTQAGTTGGNSVPVIGALAPVRSVTLPGSGSAAVPLNNSGPVTTPSDIDTSQLQIVY